LYRLLDNPEYLEPLREEVDAAIEEEGWTKAGMDKMYKLDSFVRETQRLDGFTIRSLDLPLELRDTDQLSTQFPRTVSCCDRSHFPTV
jgi:hypothetical protein